MPLNEAKLESMNKGKLPQILCRGDNGNFLRSQQEKVKGILLRTGTKTLVEPHSEKIHQCQKLQEETGPGSGPKLHWKLQLAGKKHRKQALRLVQGQHKLQMGQEQLRQGLGVRCSVQWRSLANNPTTG